MAVIHGRNLIVKIDDTAVAGSRSCSLTMQSDLLEVTAPNEGEYNHYIAGRKEWQVKCSFLVIDNAFKTFPMMVGQTVTLEFVDRNGVGLHGQAIVKQCEISSAISNLAQGSFTFQGNGELLAKRNILPSLTSGWEGEGGATVAYDEDEFGIRCTDESVDLYTPAIWVEGGEHLCFSLQETTALSAGECSFCYIHDHNWIYLSDIYDNGSHVTKTMTVKVVRDQNNVSETRMYATFVMPEDGYLTVYLPSSYSWIYRPMLELGDTPHPFEAP